MVFKQKMFEPHLVVGAAQRLFNDYSHKSMTDADVLTHGNPTNDSPESVWVPPLPGGYKINVDGAFKDGLMAAAAVVRNEAGLFIGGSCEFLNFGSPLEAEGHALKLALDLIDQLQLTNVTVESDSVTAIISIVDADRAPPWKIRNIVVECRDRLSSTVSPVHFFYTPRSLNKTAHELAKAEYNGRGKKPLPLSLKYASTAV